MFSLPVSAHKPNPSADSSSRAGASGAENGNANGSGKMFTFRELAMATKTFRQECLLGEGGFGRVFKGTLQSTGQVQCLGEKLAYIPNSIVILQKT